MFQALFNSLSGLFSFSRSLNTVSDNISNMNTPGFRGSDTFFSNIDGNRGARISGEGMRTQAGDIRQTSNPTDLAVSGDGYFVLRDKEGNLYYTRAGQFRFNGDGILTDSVNEYQVMGIDAAGNLTPVDYTSYRMLPASATTAVKLTGNLAPGAANTVTNGITVYDANGTAHTLTVKFSSKTNSPPTFEAVVTDATGATLSTSIIAFNVDGTPQVGSTEIVLSPVYGGTTQTITLKLGTAGALDGLRSLMGVANTVTSKIEDGHPALGVTGMKFDDKGVLQLTYSGAEKRQGPQLALAIFPNEGELRLSGGRLISGATVTQREFGRAGEGRFGRIAGNSLEMSNVNLTQEFADMIIIQRGYQASSRVMTVSNEMLDQLYNSTRGG
ncbi:flagellar basal-body rod protein FlgF [Lysobacter pythonis]|uniref:Flagellar basal-body rod protein FlgF n=1 Tax=Solilutibacter pythonis TaxID=2483112 RepID=A0A3M2HYC6_9GAMM|nr:flagellar basal-body rod protein FlgF [Lysobacter pythonis]RMH94058.1 flagellar basal-body rod protein FlgF [Lysobacter pythonis]